MHLFIKCSWFCEEKMQFGKFRFQKGNEWSTKNVKRIRLGLNSGSDQRVQDKLGGGISVLGSFLN